MWYMTYNTQCFDNIDIRICILQEQIEQSFWLIYIPRETNINDALIVTNQDQYMTHKLWSQFHVKYYLYIIVTVCCISAVKRFYQSVDINMPNNNKTEKLDKLKSSNVCCNICGKTMSTWFSWTKKLTF
jgi:hypothetical protein